MGFTSVVAVMCSVLSGYQFIAVHRVDLNTNAMIVGGGIFAFFAAFLFLVTGELSGCGKVQNASTGLWNGQALKLICISELPDGLESKYVDVVAELRPEHNMYLQVWFSSEQQEKLKKTKQVPLMLGYWYRHTEYGMIEPLLLKKRIKTEPAFLDESDLV